jgi:hypothetical protein
MYVQTGRVTPLYGSITFGRLLKNSEVTVAEIPETRSVIELR